jgi:hypothetical protein
MNILLALFEPRKGGNSPVLVIDQVTETYQFDTAGLKRQVELYRSLHDDIIATRRRLLNEPLEAIER